MKVDYTKPLPPLTDVQIARFWSKVTKSKDGCWEWTGKCHNKDGYAVFTVGTRELKAYRVAWFLETGSDPHGYLVCHQCDNPKCVRFFHLFLGSNLENSLDRHQKGRDATGERHGTKIHGSSYLPHGENHHHAKLTTKVVGIIRRLHRTGLQQALIASRLGVHRVTIWKVIHRQTWNHVP